MELLFPRGPRHGLFDGSWIFVLNHRMKKFKENEAFETYNEQAGVARKIFLLNENAAGQAAVFDKLAK